MRGLESEMERRTVTYTTWNLSAKKAEAKSWHPLTFTSENSGPEEIEEIKVQTFSSVFGLDISVFRVNVFVVHPCFFIHAY